MWPPPCKVCPRERGKVRSSNTIPRRRLGAKSTPSLQNRSYLWWAWGFLALTQPRHGGASLYQRMVSALEKVLPPQVPRAELIRLALAPTMGSRKLERAFPNSAWLWGART